MVSRGVVAVRYEFLVYMPIFPHSIPILSSTDNQLNVKQHNGDSKWNPKITRTNYKTTILVLTG